MTPSWQLVLSQIRCCTCKEGLIEMIFSLGGICPRMSCEMFIFVSLALPRSNLKVSRMPSHLTVSRDAESCKFLEDFMELKSLPSSIQIRPRFSNSNQRQCRHSCLAGSRRPSIHISIFQGSCGGLALGGHTTRQRASLSMAFRGSANRVWWGIATVGRNAAHFCSCSFSIAVF